MRLFAAVGLEKELENRAGQVLSKCARVKSGVKWVKKDRLHLTLEFFGEQPESALASLKDALSMAARRYGSFSIELGGCGAFPNLERPRVLFVPMTRGQEPLEALAREVRAQAAVRGFQEPEEDFHPHLTLGRVRSSSGVVQAIREWREVSPERLGKMRVEGFSLFESRLMPEGPEYRVLETFPLEGGGDPQGMEGP